MYKDSENMVSCDVSKNFDFFNTKVINAPKELNKTTRITLVITLSLINIIAIPYIMNAGMQAGNMLGEKINQSIHRDLTSLK